MFTKCTNKPHLWDAHLLYVILVLQQVDLGGLRGVMRQDPRRRHATQHLLVVRDLRLVGLDGSGGQLHHVEVLRGN